MQDHSNNELENEETIELINKFEVALSRSKNEIMYFDIDELDLIIDYYLFQSDIDMSKKALDYAINLHGNNIYLQLKKAKVHFVDGDFNKTINICANIPELSGDYLGIYAESLLHLGDAKGSDVIFRRFIMECEIDDLLTIYLDIINLYLNEFKFDLAYKWINEANKVIPNNAYIYNEYAYYYDLNSELDKAIEMYNKSIDIDPYKADTWGMLGSVYFKQQNIEAALEAFNFSITINPDNFLSTLQKAHCLFNLNRYEEAIIEYEKYLQINEYDSTILCFYAECFENLEDYNKAIKYYLKSLDLDENNIDAMLGLSACYNEMGNFIDEAYKYAHKVYSLDPTNIEALTTLGNIHLNLTNTYNDDDFKNALFFFAKALEVEPENAKLNFDIGNMYLQYSIFDKALYYYEKSYAQDPNIDKILILLAIVYYGTNDITKWKIFFDKAIEVYPNAEEIFYSIFRNDDYKQ